MQAPAPRQICLKTGTNAGQEIHSKRSFTAPGRLGAVWARVNSPVSEEAIGADDCQERDVDRNSQIARYSWPYSLRIVNKTPAIVSSELPYVLLRLLEFVRLFFS